MTDLILVGGGTAGMAAAATAAELGLRTVVLEKTGRLGGQLHWSSGHFSAAGTRRQRRRGIDDGPDLHFADVMAVGHNRNDPDLVRLAVRTAPAAVDWLEDLGFPFAEETPALVSGHELYSRPRTYWGGDDPRTGGIPIYDTLAPRVRSPHVAIRPHTGVQALVLTTGDVGLAAAGVVTDDGEAIPARHVVLATGGYAANRALVARYQPGQAAALTGCIDHATGDGHVMLERLGAEITHTDTYVPTMGMIEDPDRSGFGIPLHEARVIVNANDRPPWEVWVNQEGRRFVAEDTSSPYERERALLEQPRLAMWVVWDEVAMESAPPVIGPDWTTEQIRAEAARHRFLFRAGTLSALAVALGVDPGGLQGSVEQYNRLGTDPLGRVHKPLPVHQPPFYGVRCVGGMLLSRGGPRVDGELRPLDAKGRPVAGLYAVGELLGMGQFSGDSFAGGMSVGPALGLGRWVVQRIAARLGVTP